MTGIGLQNRMSLSGNGGREYLGTLTAAYDGEGHWRHGRSVTYVSVTHGQASPSPHTHRTVPAFLPSFPLYKPPSKAPKVFTQTHPSYPLIPPRLLSSSSATKPHCNTRPLCPPQDSSSPRLRPQKSTAPCRRV